MRLGKLDLNLLVAFDALMQERSVSAAAERLCLSQSAMSGCLARLREYFEDDLLVVVGRRMVPTARALELQKPVADALLLIRSTIMTPIQFDPATASRQFTIVASDYVYDVLLADVLQHVSAQAPNISFDVVAPNTITHELFELGEIDLFITLKAYLGKGLHPVEDLFSDQLSVIAWDQNGDCANGVSKEVYCALPHVIPVFGPNRTSAYSEQVLEKLDVQRRITMRVVDFGAVAQAVVGTNRLGTMNRRHADYFARHLPLKVFPLPFDAPPLVEAMQWHRMRQNDAGLQWLVDCIRSGARSSGLHAS